MRKWVAVSPFPLFFALLNTELKQRPNIVLYKELTMPNINSLDLAVGIPSYNEADNIEFVVRQVAAGLEKYLPHLSTVIVNADNFSQDGTKEAFMAADSGTFPRYISPHRPG